MSYAVSITRTATKELRALPDHVIQRVHERILSLAEEPVPRGAKKLKGRRDYRIRVGDYRIIYEVFHESKTIEISVIRHRSSAYR